jgi:hypothetical protein
MCYFVPRRISIDKNSVNNQHMNEFNNDTKTSNIVLFIFYLTLYNFRLNNVIKI